MTSTAFHGREYILALFSLGGEYAAARYSIPWLGWLAALFLWLAFLSYTRHYFKGIEWERYGAGIGSAALIAAITFYLTKPNELQSVNLYHGNVQLNGQTIDGTYTSGTDERSVPGKFVLRDIRAERVGRHPTDQVTLVLYFSGRVICDPGVDDCHPIGGNEGFSTGFEWSGLPPINPNQSWPAPVFRGIAEGNLPSTMRARLEIFYGEALPGEANFTVNVRKIGAY